MNSIRLYLFLFLICIFTVSLAQDDRTNINYQNAIMLTEQNGSCSTGNYVDLNSLSTNYGDRTSSCVSDTPTEDYISLWYKATVPSSGKLTIETFGPEGYEDGSSSTIVAYTLSGTALTEIGCGAYQAGVGDFTIIELTDQTIGTVIYIIATDREQLRVSSVLLYLPTIFVPIIQIHWEHRRLTNPCCRITVTPLAIAYGSKARIKSSL